MPGTLQWPGFDRPATFGLWSERESEQAALGRALLRISESVVRGGATQWGLGRGTGGSLGFVLGSI